MTALSGGLATVNFLNESTERPLVRKPVVMMVNGIIGSVLVTQICPFCGSRPLILPSRGTSGLGIVEHVLLGRQGNMAPMDRSPGSPGDSVK